MAQAAAERGGGNGKEVGALLAFGKKRAIDMRTPKKAFSIVENSARHSPHPDSLVKYGRETPVHCGNFIYITIGRI